jgi:hypothetical protein
MILKLTLIAATVVLICGFYSFSVIASNLGQAQLKNSLLQQGFLVTAQADTNI